MPHAALTCRSSGRLSSFHEQPVPHDAERPPGDTPDADSRRRDGCAGTRAIEACDGLDRAVLELVDVTTIVVAVPLAAAVTAATTVRR